GASSPVGFDVFGFGFKIGDALPGSLGNDTITSNSLSQPDYLTTTGGADTINLAAGHTGIDHVGVYVRSGLAQAAAAIIPDGVANSTTALQGNREWALPGFWGIPTNGSAKLFDGGGQFPNGFGTSGSNSTVNNFNPTLDVLDFNARVWAHNNVAGGVFGLSAIQAGAGTPVNTDTAGLASTFGTAVTAQQVANGGSMKPPARTDGVFFPSERSAP